MESIYLLPKGAANISSPNNFPFEYRRIIPLLICSLHKLYPESHSKKTLRRIIEIPQRTRIFKANCCLNIHKAHLKLGFLDKLQINVLFRDKICFHNHGNSSDEEYIFLMFPK